RFFPIYPTSVLLRYHFPVHTYLKKMTIPVTLLHGTADEVIPYAQASRLAAENPSSKLITIPSGRHNNLAGFPRFQAKLDSLLSQN
ncbi:MAG TPA: hypothetical protein VHK91_08420, partial [Flavisolibacter sp.]|nr:hypothetical protein [Flavisolibacter sp.]